MIFDLFLSANRMGTTNGGQGVENEEYIER